MSKSNEYQYFINKSLFLAVLFHTLLILLFYLTYFDINSAIDEEEVTIDFKEYETKKIEAKFSRANTKRKVAKVKLPSQKIIRENVISEAKALPDSSFLYSIQDTIFLAEIPLDSSAVLDFFIINNPGIAVLKLAVGQNIKSSEEEQETEEEKIQKNFKKQLLAYYKLNKPISSSSLVELEPTPNGTMVKFNIPFDAIISLFK